MYKVNSGTWGGKKNRPKQSQHVRELRGSNTNASDKYTIKTRKGDSKCGSINEDRGKEVNQSEIVERGRKK